jgi:acid phosphatase type 7
MKVIFFRRFGHFLSIAALIGLTSLVPGPDKLSSTSEVALAASDPVIAAAGDIACDPTNSSFNGGNGTSGSCRPKYTSDLLVNAGLAAVLALGDNQYYCGGYQAYLQSYDLSWGRVKSITRPSVGNHEYLTSGGTDCNSANSGAAGYFNYFGAAAGNPGQGYYSFDIGTWHLIAINSNCSSAGGCGSSSPQGQWLAADLAAHTNFCTLAYWHIPLFSSGGRASSNTQSIWQTLYNNNVDVVLNGHDHIYERFAPQTPNGTLDTARGIREFIVGSGGANHTSLATIFANSEVRNTDTYGVLKLTLHPTSFDWQFVPEAGKTFTDSGTQNCHGSTSNGTPLPTATNTTTGTPTLTPSNTATSTIGPSPTRTPTATNMPPATFTSTFSPTPVVNNFTFAVEADARVKQASPTSNYGTLSYVSVDGAPDPIEESYLRFTVGGVSGPIQNAKLRVFVSTNATTNGPAVYLANNSWTESGMTWNTKPALLSGPSDNKGSLTTNTWVEYDVTPLLTGNGTYTFALIADSTDGAELSSREGGIPAQLVITVATATSTLTQTSTLTPTSTRTSTATATVERSPTFTSTSTRTPTAGPSPTFTSTFTRTPTSTSTAPSTSTSTATSTLDPSPTSSSPTVMVVTDTPTIGPSPTLTPIILATAPPSPTSTRTSTPTPTITSTPAPITFVFAPTDDSYVDGSNSTANFGSATTFRVDGSPIVRTYIRFNVQGLSGTITRVSLRVFANSSSSSGYTVSSVSDNTWTEATINYNNAPPLGGAVVSSNGFSGGVWTTVDITSLVTGNGTYNLALTTSSSTAISLASRESGGANSPQLIVETVP